LLKYCKILIKLFIDEEVEETSDNDIILKGEAKIKKLYGTKEVKQLNQIIIRGE
jgi:hypothetical protein